jgi:hypothetical protein
MKRASPRPALHLLQLIEEPRCRRQVNVRSWRDQDLSSERHNVRFGAEEAMVGTTWWAQNCHRSSLCQGLLTKDRTTGSVVGVVDRLVLSDAHWSQMSDLIVGSPDRRALSGPDNCKLLQVGPALLTNVESNRTHPRSRLTIWHKRALPVSRLRSTGALTLAKIAIRGTMVFLTGSSNVLTEAASLSGSALGFDRLRDKAL